MRVLTFSALICLFGASLVAGSYRGPRDNEPTPSYENPVRDAPDDEIKNLPGLNDPISFRQYSGYLKADDENTTSKFFHYWFVESQRDPADRPLILWLNGGPGCSSLGGMFTELGPFSVNQDGKTLKLNQYSWNKYANVLFLESPAEVGFSYSHSLLNIHTDDTTARENYLALKSFLEKFPHYKKNPLYLTGESYAGVYLPLLGVLVDADPEINLKGLAIGNGYLDTAKLTDSLVFFAYYHGLVGKSVWDSISKHCCGGQAPTREYCKFQNAGFHCRYAISSIQNVLAGPGLNPYNLYGKCLSAQVNSSSTRSQKTTTTRELIDRNLMALGFNFHPSQSARGHHVFNVSELSLNGYQKTSMTPPCFDDHLLTKYLNNPEVRSAIHIPKEAPEWSTCSLIVYIMKYAKLPGGMSPQIKKLIASNKKLKLLIYNGDVDTVCNFLGDEWFVDDLDRKLISNYQPWTSGNQVVGFMKKFDGITFATVKGSGHMVPQDKPSEAFDMIYRYLLLN